MIEFTEKTAGCAPIFPVFGDKPFTPDNVFMNSILGTTPELMSLINQGHEEAAFGVKDMAWPLAKQCPNSGERQTRLCIRLMLEGRRRRAPNLLRKTFPL